MICRYRNAQKMNKFPNFIPCVHGIGILYIVCCAITGVVGFTTKCNTLIKSSNTNTKGLCPLLSYANANENRRPEQIYQLPSPKIKSKELSSFWFTAEEKVQTLGIPCQYHLDSDGPLPLGAYRFINDDDDDDGNRKRSCILSAGLNFSNLIDEVNTNVAVANAQKLIDSGLTTFQLNGNGIEKKRGIAPCTEQAWIEQNIYRKLIIDTPSSVLSLCNFSTDVSIPGFDGAAGINSYVRQQVGASILNMYGSTSGCIDSIQVNFRAGNQKSRTSASPLTFDVLDVLFDMQRDGLIRSINGKNFPVLALDEMKQCGFFFDTNQVACSLLNPNEFAEMQKYARDSDRDGKPLKINMNRPLAGGLLTGKFLDVPDQYRTNRGEPTPQYMTGPEQYHYDRTLKGTWRNNYNRREGEAMAIPSSDAWLAYEQKIVRTLSDLSLKHSVDISTVALRWAMQQDHVGTIAVGTSLNTRVDPECPFRFPKQMRKAFSLHLEEEDLDRLLNVSGLSPSNGCGMQGVDEFDQIDFSNQKLWL